MRRVGYCIVGELLVTAICQFWVFWSRAILIEEYRDSEILLCPSSRLRNLIGQFIFRAPLIRRTQQHQRQKFPVDHFKT
eukprot:scaffold13293_cov120-Cylindrotheca_fusiformis.AAC.12